MGKSCNSHGKKSDKETQSPMLKIFREIMQRENADPEKAKLLKEKRKYKKRKQYSTSQSKSDMVKSGESSCNEQNRKSKMQYNVLERNRDYSQSQRTQSFPYQSDKKDSWWFWGGSKEAKSKAETCSCVSCALKRIVSNEYACVGCLLCLFTISVIVAFLLICKAVPVASTKAVQEPGILNVKRNGKGDSVNMKKTIEMLHGKKDFLANLRGRRHDDSRSVWSNLLSKRWGRLPDVPEPDFGDSSFQESNGQVEGNRLTGPISSFTLDTRKLLTNERLKSFYKKLMETDIQIRNLKKGIYPTQSSILSPAILKDYPDRLKRSLLLKKPYSRIQKRIHKFKKNHTNLDTVKNTNDNFRVRRFENGSAVPTGFIFEKKKLFIQYMPVEKKVFPKCSHVPKDLHSNEHDLKHPFYKNTQRLDDMLDQFLDKNFPEMLGYDPHADKRKTCRHGNYEITKSPLKYIYDSTERAYNKFVKPNVVRAKKIKSDIFRILNTDSSTVNKRNWTSRLHTWKDEIQKSTKEFASPTDTYDLVLSISTLINPTRRSTKHCIEDSTMNVRRVQPFDDNVVAIVYDAVKKAKKPGRKLLQFDEDEDEGLGYDDLKEVLSDDMAAHDETDRQVERTKRDESSRILKPNDKPVVSVIKYNPPGVHNPNWKGPMPLYPDELSSMIKQDDTSKNLPDTGQHKTESLVTNETGLYLGSKIGSFDEDIYTEQEDVQYIEDYTKDKYDKLAQMAQAYSDYGVLDLKKEQHNEKNPIGKEKDRRIKLTQDDLNFFISEIVGRPKKGAESEGIRFEIRTGGQTKDIPTELFKSLSKHMKFTNDDRVHKHGFHSTTLVPVSTEFDNAKYTTHDQTTTTKKQMYPDEHEEMMYFNEGTKILKSADSVSNYDMNKNPTFENIDTNEELIVENVDDNSKYYKSRSLKSVNSDSGDLFTIHQDATENKYEFPFKARVRKSVKSIDFDIEKIINEDNAKSQVVSESNENKTTPEMVNIDDIKINETIAENSTKDINVDVKQINTNNSVLDASQFFNLLSSWFNILSGMSNETGTLKGTSSNVTFAIKPNKPKKSTTTAKTTKYLEYPMYDSDMIDNIGHRSRVLLSIEENKNTSGESGGKAKENENAEVVGGMSVDAEKTLAVKPKYDTTEVIITIADKTNVTDKDANAKTNEETKDNKTIVKRSAEDTNLIFWNDMYDEEYGVNQDVLDNTEENTDNVNVFKKPGQWLNDKMMKLTDTMRKTSASVREWTQTKKKPLLSRMGITFPKKKPINSDKLYHRIEKRSDIFSEKELDEEDSQEVDFNALTNHMKQVLKQAAEAVRHTKSIEVRENSVVGTATAGLMQQLIQLMTDLVDFQVQQKTCLQLPSDLKDFLGWLMNIHDPVNDLKNTSSNIDDYATEPVLKEDTSTAQVDLVVSKSSETEVPDPRSDCLGTLQAVQNLMQQYNDMSAEEKSTMTGVKEYLETQLDFLNKKLADYNQYSLENLYTNGMPLRYRRHIQNKNKLTNTHHRHRGKRRNRHRLKRKLNRFLRNYGKKHTRTTANSIDFVVATDTSKKLNTNFENVDKNESFHSIEKSKREGKNDKDVKEKTKRNLIDVYYKALANAKKKSTEKTVLKKEFHGFDKNRNGMIQN